MKKYNLLFAFLFVSVLAFSQKAVIVFDKITHDFGSIQEEDGKATYVFNFTNKGMSPLVVNKVQASCGCTTPTWTKEPIEPGKKGSITVNYNPVGRPGSFTKSITVSSNGGDEDVVLVIKGVVQPKMTGENNVYPVTMGPLRIKAKVVQLDRIYKGSTQTRSIDIQNTAKTDLKPTIEGLPSHITATISPEILKPQQEGKISFTIDTKKSNHWGLNYDEVFVVLNGAKKTSDEYKLSISSNVVEDFSKLTIDQKRKAPILEVPTKSLNLGTIKAGALKTAKFKLNNKGQNPLEIRRIANNNRELWIRQSKMTIASGRSADISVDVITKGLGEGTYKRTMTIQTNDPDNTYYILSISWSISK